VLNLINEDKKVFSMVVPAVGNAPFAAVVDLEELNGILGRMNEISVADDQLLVGDTLVSFGSAEVWDPIPDWEVMAAIEKIDLIDQIEEQLQSAAGGEGMTGIFYFPGQRENNTVSRFVTLLEEGSSLLLNGLVKGDSAEVMAGAAALAGLGVGLTPSGDDFLMGVMYGLRATKPKNAAEQISDLIYQEVAGRTTTLSAAWLEAASLGEAGEKWHALVGAVCTAQPLEIKNSIRGILQIGETSGADALAGFVELLKLEQEQ
jgi:hypothetical protein